MLNHVMVGTNDIDRAKRFYDAVLGALGAAEGARNVNATGQTRLFYRHDGSTFGVSEPIDGQPATHANGGTIGFKCKSAEQLRDFHARPSRMAGGRSRARLARATANQARCTWPTCVTRTATSSARSTGQPEAGLGGTRLGGAAA